MIALGFCLVPSLLLRPQNPLGAQPDPACRADAALRFLWERDRKPYPGEAVLSKRLDLSPRQVQRHIADLELAGLVMRVEGRAMHGES